ncbi:hypothetical protein GUJ93_ZPchr0005g14742 [Zizania palustris]|uniref:Uncharacterized protein n=1 Tax=Zizania palustris TaxID=103762 RepID=A0A8J5QRB6_ZIZPA|nr:hypothetical protein GUJ93_ZPchr0434g33226 [Zizania palustris]KAG8069169.1 hypothetical protein GUJ93_ZPchr0005g14742 [Zizania palustris]
MLHTAGGDGRTVGRGRLEKNFGVGASKKHFVHEFVGVYFHSPAGTEGNAKARLWLVGDYTYFLTSIHHHKDLLFPYNIAVVRLDEMKKILDKYAASVDLELPDIYQS